MSKTLIMAFIVLAVSGVFVIYFAVYIIKDILYGIKRKRIGDYLFFIEKGI